MNRSKENNNNNNNNNNNTKKISNFTSTLTYLNHLASHVVNGGKMEHMRTYVIKAPSELSTFYLCLKLYFKAHLLIILELF